MPLSSVNPWATVVQSNLGPIRLVSRLAKTESGLVFEAVQLPTRESRLVVMSTPLDQNASQRLAAHQEPATLDWVTTAEATMIILPRSAEQQAARLIGLDQLPKINWFRKGYGSSLRPRTVSQLLFRIGTIIVLFTIMGWIVQLIFLLR